MVKTGVYSFMQDEYRCIPSVHTRILAKNRVFKGFSGENRCILGEYRWIWERTCIQLTQDEYWCLLVYRGVYTRILMEKRGFTDIAVKTGVI